MPRLWSESIETPAMLTRITAKTFFQYRMLPGKLVLVVSFMLITGCTGPMIQDIAPPRSVQSTPLAVSSVFGVADISPLLPPDPDAGEAIFMNECAPCHGDSGMGDGPRAEKLPVIPPPVGSPAYSRAVPPTRWFQVITQGRIDRLMPGYGASLSDRQRWDIVAYLMTLGTTPEQIARGWNAYRSECQECHGTETTSGIGNSPKLSGPELFHRSVDDLVSVLTYDRNSLIHAGIQLPDDEKVNIFAFLRTLVFHHPTTGAENALDPPSTSVTPPLAITITGRVINGSGGSVPVHQSVKLLSIDGNAPGFSRETTTGRDGRFVFNEVPAAVDRTYMVSTRYRDIEYTSEGLQSGQPDELDDFRLTVYETDTDTSLVTADRVHIFFEYPRSDTIRVVQLFVLNNPTNRMVTASSAGGVVINYPLPPGALNLQFQNGTLGQRFLMTADGIGDTQPVTPGDSTQVLFSYDLPYRGEAVFDVNIPVKTETVNVLLAAEGVTLKSSQLQEVGEKNVQNNTWRLFTAAGMDAGAAMHVQISGKPRVTTPRDNEMSSSLAVGTISLVIVVVFITTILFRDVVEKRTQVHEAAMALIDTVDRDAILDAIIALDDQYQAGQIPAAAYHERRAELKNRLERILE